MRITKAKEACLSHSLHANYTCNHTDTRSTTKTHHNTINFSYPVYSAVSFPRYFNSCFSSFRWHLASTCYLQFKGQFPLISCSNWLVVAGSNPRQGWPHNLDSRMVESPILNADILQVRFSWMPPLRSQRTGFRTRLCISSLAPRCSNVGSSLIQLHGLVGMCISKANAELKTNLA